MSIVHWNIRGYRANYEEIKVLIHERSPVCICLQETYHGDTVPFAPTGYTVETADPVVRLVPGERPPRGVMSLISKEYPYYKINLVTNLETIAIRIHVGKQITLCNIYITPDEIISSQQINNLITQLPKPFILVGDFNARSNVWGDVEINDHGQVISDILATSDICILNNGDATHLHKQTNSITCIDLALTSPDILTDVQWEADQDTRGSDHFPCYVNINAPQASENANVRYRLEKAD